MVWHCQFWVKNIFVNTVHLELKEFLNILAPYSKHLKFENSSYSLLGIFVSIMVFLLMKIIASKLRKSRFCNKSSNRADNVVCDGQSSEIFTVPSDNKIVINNFHLVINSCECRKCKDCPEKRQVFENCENTIDQELLLSVVKSKFPNLWL